MKPILIIGSINMDVILAVDKSPKAGESIFAQKTEEIPGGKGANQAVAVSRLGHEAVFCCRIGNDAYGERLLNHLKQENIDISLVESRKTSTGIAYIILEQNGQNRIIVDPGANNSFTLEDMANIIPKLTDYSMILLQLEIPLDCVSYIIQEATKVNVPVIVDAGPIRGCTIEQLAGAWCISPNETEIESLVNFPINGDEDALVACRKLLSYDVQCVLLKQGEKGSLYVDRNVSFSIPAYKVPVVDTTAAGDSFTAGFAVGIVQGIPIKDAVILATKAGALAVTKKGAQTSLPYREEVDAFESTGNM